MREYTKSDIEQLTGISQRKIQFLVDYKIIDPKERGRGKPIIYDERNLIEIMMAQVLRDRKISNLSILWIFGLLRRIIKEKKGCVDFFTSNKWGNTHDILYSEAPRLGVGFGNIQTCIESVGPDYTIPEKTMNDVIRVASGPITLIPMGKVKKEALSRLKR